MLRPDYPIETGRLLLRPILISDVEDIYVYQSDPDVCRYVSYQPRTRERIAELITSGTWASQVENEGDALCLAVERAGVVIGEVMLFYRSIEQRRGEIGWVFNPAYHGHGYATEAARVIFRLGFDGLGLRRIYARIDARNTASAAMAVRLGMRQEAHFVEGELFKGEWADELNFALLDREWPALAPTSEPAPA
jgi:RimJ/RimL family protein N-acetyltransferase